MLNQPWMRILCDLIRQSIEMNVKMSENMLNYRKWKLFQ